MSGESGSTFLSYESAQPAQDVEGTSAYGEAVNTGQGHVMAGGASNANSRKKRPGRPSVDARREGNNMNGCKPFLAQANRLLSKKRGSIAPKTVEEAGRKYRMLDEWLTDLKKEGKISTTDPHSMTEEDIRGIMEFLRERAKDLGYRAKLVGLIEQVLVSADNSIIGKMRVEGYRFPRTPLKPIRALSEDNLDRVQRATLTMEGWRGDIARFMVWIYPYTAFRPSELRLAHLEDINTKDWKIFVRHPKGEDAGYGIPQWVSILPPARPYVLRFLEARKVHLESNGFPADSWPLIPCIYRGEVKEYSSNNFRVIKKKIEEVAQMDFKLKDFRSTCAQMIKDRNKGPTEIATKQLRHSGPDTTYRSYARIRSDTANEEVNNLFPQNDLASIPNVSCLRKHPDGK